MSTTPATAPPPLAGPLEVPVAPGFAGAFRGLWMLTWKTKLSLRRMPWVVIGLLALPVLMGFTLPSGRVEPFCKFSITLYLMLLVGIQCLADFGAMIRDEIQTDTLRFLITRPVPRMQFLVIKYLCHLILAEALAFICGCLILGVGWLRDIPDLGSFAAWFLLAQALAILAYGALSTLLGLISQRYMVIGVLYGFVVEMGIGQIPTNVNNLSISRHLRTLLANNPAIAAEFDWTPDRTLFSIFMVVLAAAVFLTLAAFLFAHREYHAHSEMQK